MPVPASAIIKRLGGQTRLAEGLGVTQSAVSRWASRGRIPTDRWADLIVYAASVGKPVSVDDLMPEGVAEAAAKTRRRPKRAA